MGSLATTRTEEVKQRIVIDDSMELMAPVLGSSPLPGYEDEDEDDAEDEDEERDDDESSGSDKGSSPSPASKGKSRGKRSPTSKESRPRAPRKVKQSAGKPKGKNGKDRKDDNLEEALEASTYICMKASDTYCASCLLCLP